jgi:predicted nucleotidyltransferase
MDAEKLLKEQREAIMPLADKHGAHSVRVFGSVARGDFGPEGDVDLLVKMEERRSLLDLSAMVLGLKDSSCYVGRGEGPQGGSGI